MNLNFEIPKFVEPMYHSAVADATRLFAEYGGPELIFYGKAAIIFIVMGFIFWCASHLLVG